MVGTDLMSLVCDRGFLCPRPVARNCWADRECMMIVCYQTGRVVGIRAVEEIGVQ